MIVANVRFGSKADERGHRHEGPLLGVKRTKRVEKRTLALKVGLSPEFVAHVPGCTENAQTSAVAGSGVFVHPGTRGGLRHEPQLPPVLPRSVRETARNLGLETEV